MKEGVSRRKLLKMAGAAALGPAMPPRLFASQEPLVPSDKGLSREWIKSLTARGLPRACRDPKGLRNIGMPVGGICCGQIYFGGDGRLWLWDIFGAPPEDPNRSAGTHYANPMAPDSKFDFRFEIGGTEMHPLDATFFEEVSFEGRYPAATVSYRKAGFPLEAKVEVLSPFVPIDAEISGLPVFRVSVQITNRSAERQMGKSRCRFTNPCGQFSGYSEYFEQDEKSISAGTWKGRQLSAKAKTIAGSKLPAIELSNWQDGAYGDWKAEGTAFGPGSVDRDKLPERLNPAKPKRQFFVNTHEARKGEDSVAADRHKGKLTSPSFSILRKYLCFWIGGGNHPGETCMNLIVDGKVVRSETGRNSSVLRGVSWDISDLMHKEAFLQIVDSHTGGWGHVSIDWPHLSEQPLPPSVPIESLPDFGSIAVGARTSKGGSAISEANSVGGSINLKPGETAKIDFLIAYHFPNYGDAHAELRAIKDFDKLKRYYARNFKDAEAVLEYAVKNEGKIFGAAEKWVETWYDSTLPYWFLERTLLPVDCLQTATAHRFDNGRFYGWEGIYCCAGTCQHVWNYAQAEARLFPELSRDTRERVDYGLALLDDGAIGYRAETAMHIAHDGQAGTIIRTYREHATSPNYQFLKRNWPKIKKAIRRLIQDDKDKDGIIEGWQYNTLDSAWYGEISWISSLYLAALQAGRAMALDMGDAEFERELAVIIERGRKNISERLFNGEFFIQRRDPAHLEAPGSGIGCHIDQVFGDSYMHMVGLEPVLPRDKVRMALQSLWKYNFVPDAGDYRKKIAKLIPGGRWYAMDGEAGLLMTTFPKGGTEDAPGKGNPNWMVGYFNECMNGFEYQVAAHMMAEGMVTEGLAIVRSLEDRYSAEKRNPYNEIECSDHYSRSMAAYGAFLTACGFAFHGPKGVIRLAPKISPEKFRAAFTAAEGWGTYSQKFDAKLFEAKIEVKWGKLKLTQVELSIPKGLSHVEIAYGSQKLAITNTEKDGMTCIKLAKPVTISTGKSLSVIARTT